MLAHLLPVHVVEGGLVEVVALQAPADELAARLDKAAENDKKLVVASLLFLPTLFAIGGTKEEEAEYGRLKGEHAALEQASGQKGCAVPASRRASADL